MKSEREIISMLLKRKGPTDMLDKETFIVDILFRDFFGNKTLCAKTLGISKGYLYSYINSDSARAGRKLLLGVYNHCIEKKRSPEKYFLPKKK